MATYGNESLNNYVYSSYNPYSYRCPKHKGWRQKNYLSVYGNGEAYFDNYHRAQLKSILSQINPNLTPRLRKANTRDVAVQVNPRAHASVQCSLGPRTLAARRQNALRRRGPDGQTPGSPVSGGVRFPRTQAVYSPIATRGLAALLEEHSEEEKGEEEQERVEGQEAKSGKKSKLKFSPGKKEETEQNKVEDEGPSLTEKSAPEDLKVKVRVRFQVSDL